MAMMVPANVAARSRPQQVLQRVRQPITRWPVRHAIAVCSSRAACDVWRSETNRAAHRNELRVVVSIVIATR
jgi:hypothetical protein